MKLEIELSDETIDAIAEGIASKLNMNGGGGATAVEEADDFETETEKELTLTDMQDAIKEAVGTHGKDKIKAVVKKVSGAAKVADIPKDKYQAVLDALKKVK